MTILLTWIVSTRRAGLRKSNWWILSFLVFSALGLEAQPSSPAISTADVWQVPVSQNLMPHFEAVNGRKVLYVDGRPFTALAVEIPWWNLIYGRYKETENAYDNLYPAADKIGLNTLKVPIKWSVVEPEKGVYDFSYVDHIKSMAEKHHLKLVLNWFGTTPAATEPFMATSLANSTRPCISSKMRRPILARWTPIVWLTTTPPPTITNRLSTERLEPSELSWSTSRMWTLRPTPLS